jgi:hypothetical protein
MTQRVGESFLDDSVHRELVGRRQFAKVAVTLIVDAESCTAYRVDQITQLRQIGLRREWKDVVVIGGAEQTEHLPQLADRRPAHLADRGESAFGFLWRGARHVLTASGQRGDDG